MFSGCFGSKKYKVDFNGQKDSFSNARDYYKAGEKVEIYYPFIATDTDYTFYLDDEKISPLYEDGKGYVIKFKMPDHNVSVKVTSKNSMEYDPDAPTEDKMLVDYYTATVATAEGDSHRELVLYYYSDDEVKLSVFNQDFNEDETREDYLVPVEALDKCRSIIKKNKFDKWNDKYEDTGLDGGVTVVRYLNDKDETIRVSTDRMPDDGERKLGEIGAVLSGYVQEKYKIK